MIRISSIAEDVARRVLCGAFDVADIIAALEHARGRRLKSLATLAAQLTAQFGSGRRPRQREVAAFLSDSAIFRRAFRALEFVTAPPAEPAMQPCEGPPQHWQLPAITTPAALAEWLNILPQELLALAARWRDDGE